MGPIQSMTGFARADRTRDGIAVSVELRSVNGKGLDTRLRLPPGYDFLDLPLRQQLQKAFARGSIQAGVSISDDTTQARPVVNDAFLEQLAGKAKAMAASLGLPAPSVGDLLAVRGVVELPENTMDDDRRELVSATVADTMGEAASRLATARREEGDAVRRVLLERVDTIAALTGKAAADPSRTVEAIRERLAANVAVLMEARSGLDADRLHAEAAILATKADIAEEIDRLHAHVDAARKLISEGGPVGRKLDFLAQEFNRETNTLCSKSNAVSVTAIGLELKVVIDQFREQLQNIE